MTGPLRRKSTLAFARKHCAAIPSILDALDLPIAPDILDTIDQTPGTRFLIRGATQLLKTLCGQLHAMRSFLVEPGPALWYSHPEKAIDDFCDEKFNPLFDALPILHPLLYTDPNKRARTRLQFPAGHNFLLRSAGIKLQRQSKTARTLYFDESWTYEPGWCADIAKRRESFSEHGTWREIHMLTGTHRDTEADQYFQASDQRTWHPRCPTCHELFLPRRTHKDPTTGERIGGIVYATHTLPSGLADMGRIAPTVAYQCPHCRTRHPDTPATRLAMNGTAAAPRGRYVALNPTASTAPRTIGWHISGIPFSSWAVIAGEMVNAERERTTLGTVTLLEQIILKRDADTWDPEFHHRPENHSQHQHPTPYKLRDPWPAAQIRTCTVDVQLDHFVCIIRAWGRSSASRLHLAFIAFSPSEIARVCTEEKVAPEHVALDVRHDTQRVRTICARMGWRSMMGDKAERDYAHPDGIRRIYAEPKIIDAYTGTLLQGTTHSCVIETLFSKNSALNRLHALRSPDARTPAGEPVWTAASDAPDWYFKQVNAHYRKRVDAADGSHHHVWHGQKNDHADDCEAMAVVMATALGLTGAETMDAPPLALAPS